MTRTGVVLLCAASVAGVVTYSLSRARTQPRNARVGQETSSRIDPAPVGTVVFAYQDPHSVLAEGGMKIALCAGDGSRWRQLVSRGAMACDPVLSPDRRRIAYAVLAGKPAEVGIHVVDVDGKNDIRLTWEGTVCAGPTWSPDGKLIAYSSATWHVPEGGRFECLWQIESMPVSGGKATRVTAGMNPSWSPDGQRFLLIDPGGSLRVVASNGSGSRVLVPANGEADFVSGSWSPDGQRIVCGHADGRQFVIDSDGSGSHALPRGIGLLGTGPEWATDGDWILFTRAPRGAGTGEELWKVHADGKDARRVSRSRAFTRGVGWMEVGFLGLGREEAARQEAPQVPTVPGPEDPTVSAGLGGSLMISARGGGLDLITFPDLKRRHVLCPSGAGTEQQAALERHVGPDANGRFAYVETQAELGRKSRTALKVARLGETGTRTLLTLSGDPIWDHSISESFALSNTGGLLAYADQPKPVQLPGAYLSTGVLELRELDTNRVRGLGVRIVDGGLSWFPDGKRLACVTLSEAPPPVSPGADNFGTQFSGWKSVPVVSILDVSTGTVRPLHAGWRPVVTGDGNSVIVADFTGRLRRVDVASGRSEPFSAPGMIGPVIAAPNTECVIYFGEPTAGQRQGWTESNSPLVGPKPMETIKVATPGTRRFATVVPQIDPRWQASYGASAR